MEELTNVIKTLFHIQAQIKLLTQTLNVNFNNTDVLPSVTYGPHPLYSLSFQNSTNTILSNYHIILLNSFLDEYNKRLAYSYLGSEFKEAIIELKKRNGHCLKRLNQWTGIKAFRNHIAAHNFRNNDVSLFSNFSKIYTYKILNTNSEKNLVSGILELMCRNILEAFPTICNYHLNLNEKMLDRFEIISEEVDVKTELNLLLKSN